MRSKGSLRTRQATNLKSTGLGFRSLGFRAMLSLSVRIARAPWVMLEEDDKQPEQTRHVIYGSCGRDLAILPPGA